MISRKITAKKFLQEHSGTLRSALGFQIERAEKLSFEFAQLEPGGQYSAEQLDILSEAYRKGAESAHEALADLNEIAPKRALTDQEIEAVVRDFDTAFPNHQDRPDDAPPEG